MDLYDDNILYVMAKMKGTDPSGWVLSVNTENKKLEKVSPFSQKILFFHRIYLQCDLFKHLGKAPGDLIDTPSTTMQNYINSLLA